MIKITTLLASTCEAHSSSETELNIGSIRLADRIDISIRTDFLLRLQNHILIKQTEMQEDKMFLRLSLIGLLLFAMLTTRYRPQMREIAISV